MILLLRLKVMMNQCHCRYIEHSWVGGHDQSSYLGMFLLCLTSSVSTSSISTKIAASSKSSSVAVLLDTKRINIVSISRVSNTLCVRQNQNESFNCHVEHLNWYQKLSFSAGHMSNISSWCWSRSQFRFGEWWKTEVTLERGGYGGVM